MQIKCFDIAALALIRSRIIGGRSYFVKAWKDVWFREQAADVGFAQHHQPMSAQAGTIRGLLYRKAPMEHGKLVRCEGSIFNDAVDIRPDSTTFGQWGSETLTATGGKRP